MDIIFMYFCWVVFNSKQVYTSFFFMFYNVYLHNKSIKANPQIQYINILKYICLGTKRRWKTWNTQFLDHNKKVDSQCFVLWKPCFPNKIPFSGLCAKIIIFYLISFHLPPWLHDCMIYKYICIYILVWIWWGCIPVNIVRYILWFFLYGFWLL